MKFRAIYFFFVLFSIFGIQKFASAQIDFYYTGNVQKIEIYFSQPNWDYQLDTAKHGADGYVIADWVKINNILFNQPGVKYKGNSSYDSTYTKNPLHIELNHVTPQSYQGFTDIKLSNGYGDPSVIREVLAYDILKNYMDCPRSNFATVYINGDYIGLYSNDESINKNFCSRNFNSSSGTFFKCNPIVTPGPTTKSNLRYIPGTDSTAYFNFYELKSDFGWNDLVGLCDTVTNYPSVIEEVFDVDRLLWMLAYNTVLVNLDSYTGVFCQNYYIYRDKTNRFNPIVWDLNMAFGGFPYVGSGGTSMGSLTIANMKQLSPTFHSTDPFWPLINVVMNNSSYKKQFIAHAKTILNENFITGNYLNTAAQLQLVIDSAVQADNNAFFSYSQFQNGLTTDYQVGSYMVPGIANLMDDRATYLQTVPEFLLPSPAISSVNTSNSSPELNETIFITANVTNTLSVYAGVRGSTSEKFIRIEMFDDGLHGDGVVGDEIYGVEMPVTTLFTQYYIYAENADAAIFSPERAEHEFYTLQTNWNYPLPGEIVINEFVAVNENGKVNEYGERADWIELYNNNPSPVSLYGLYLTDNFDKRNKFALPQGAVIDGNGFFIVWADEQNSTSEYLHSNFRLAAEGEQLMLSNGSSIVLDSITYGSQLDDVSTGRCPNGNGNFQFIGNPTFADTNCENDSTSSGTPWGAITIYPNPAKNQFSFKTTGTQLVDEIRMYDFTGRSVLIASPTDTKTINIQSLNLGVYVVKFYNNFSGERKQMKLVKAANN